jgi:hypothetical protein
MTILQRYAHSARLQSTPASAHLLQPEGGAGAGGLTGAWPRPPAAWEGAPLCLKSQSIGPSGPAKITVPPPPWPHSGRAMKKKMQDQQDDNDEHDEKSVSQQQHQ